MMNWIKKAPTAVTIAAIIVCGIGGLAVLGGYVVLELQGADTGGYLSFVMVFLSAVGAATGGVSAVASTSAARSASNAEEQTNGQLTARDRKIAALQAENARLRRERGHIDGTA